MPETKGFNSSINEGLNIVYDNLKLLDDHEDTKEIQIQKGNQVTIYLQHVSLRARKDPLRQRV